MLTINFSLCLAEKVCNSITAWCEEKTNWKFDVMWLEVKPIRACGLFLMIDTLYKNEISSAMN
jgi:hypothetical protein